MTTLVTGAGLVGAWTARLLQERGETPILVDVNPHIGAIASIVDLGRVTVVTGDIGDAQTLAGIVRMHNIDRIVHTAAVLNVAAKNFPVLAVRTNVLGTAHILQAARTFGVRRVVAAGSSTVAYATLDEHDTAPISEDFRMSVISQRPDTVYTTTKLAAEHLTYLFSDLFGVDAAVLRYGAVLGDWNGPNNSLPGRFLRALLGPAMRGQTATIDDSAFVWQGGEAFIDVRDCARANIAALDARALPNKAYNISHGYLLSFDDFVAATRRRFPDFRITVRAQALGGFAGYPRIRRQPADITAARRDLGFAPCYTLSDTIDAFARFA